MMRHSLVMVLLAAGLNHAQADDGRFEYFFAGARSLTIDAKSSIEGILGLSFEDARGGILAITSFPLLSRGDDGLEAWSPLSNSRWVASRDVTLHAPVPYIGLPLAGRYPTEPLLLEHVSGGKFLLSGGASLDLGFPGFSPLPSGPTEIRPAGGVIQLQNSNAIVSGDPRAPFVLASVLGERHPVLGSLLVSSVPEPAPLLMFSVGALWLLLRRRYV